MGCGNGLFLERLSAWGEVTGIEIDASLVTDDAPLRHRIHHQPLGDPLYRSMGFGLITALDVIEHIADDAAAVHEMATLLVPGGYLMVTVPAFASLWDEHDDLNQHFRRYRAAQLRRLLEPHVRILKLRYLFPSLFPVKLAVAALNRFRRRKVVQAQIPSPATTVVMDGWLRLEDRVTGGLRLPLGTSVLALAQKALG